MDIAATKSYSDELIHNCDYCGAKLQVNVIKQTGHNEREDYNCPECNKQYHTRASMPISDVVVLEPRTDGRTDEYQNP